MTNQTSLDSSKSIDFIVNWLQNYAENANAKGFIVGISGGIDSALTSSLCAKTTLPTLCVEMPIHQATSQVNRAEEHILQLKNSFANVWQQKIDLTPTFETFRTSFSENENSAHTQLALANARARLRMTTLYYLAQLHGYLVVGTGNKVEDFGVGFFTKYGDGGVDISPIADLMKSEVKQLASALNVPNSILEAQPTDGLFGDNRTDEDQIGATYDELEWAMREAEKGKTQTDFSDREAAVFAIYQSRNIANQHKMNPIPVCTLPKDFWTN